MTVSVNVKVKTNINIIVVIIEMIFIWLEAGLRLGFTFERAPYAPFYRFPSAKFHEI